MIFIVALVLALLFFPWPWNLAVIATAAACEVVLATMGVRYTRRGRSKVGAQTMIGRTAEVVTALAPTGQVKIDGVIWQAHAQNDTPARQGETVRITGLRGLTLEVEPAPHP